MLYKAIVSQIEALEIESITLERKAILQPLIDFIQTKINSKEIINLNFICTHNSRRSHLAQVWAQTMASYFKIKNVNCYSGGTEATALFPIVANILKHTGFQIEMLTDGKNPIYGIKYAANSHPIIGFSKTFDANFNPTSNFAAILTCSSADKNCPFIAGAEQRIPLTFEDPKMYDNTTLQLDKYKERSLQIATEMKYVFSNLKI